MGMITSTPYIGNLSMIDNKWRALNTVEHTKCLINGIWVQTQGANTISLITLIVTLVPSQ